MQNPDILDLSGRHLRLFLTILDQSSLADAAREMSVDMTEAGGMLDRLRKVFQDELFVRTSRGFEPTEHALHIEATVRENLARFESLGAHSAFVPAEETRRFTIAANVTELLDEITQIREAIREEAPNAAIRFLELGARDNTEPMLESGEADIVITIQSDAYASSLNGCPFSVDKHVVFFDPACRPPVHSIDDYAEAEHATLDFGHGGESTVDRVLRQENLRRCIVLSAPDVTTLGALMKGTRLIATMQSRLARTIFSHLDYCEAPIYLPPQKFDLVWHRRVENSARSKWLRDLILHVAEASHFARD